MILLSSKTLYRGSIFELSFLKQTQTQYYFIINIQLNFNSDKYNKLHVK